MKFDNNDNLQPVPEKLLFSEIDQSVHSKSKSKRLNTNMPLSTQDISLTAACANFLTAE